MKNTIVFVFTFSFIGLIHADYLLPDTLWVNVTFYDFHADGTNPNFEACNCGRKPGMIQDTLTANRKPILNEDLCCNDRISEWFSPSGAPGSNYAFDTTTGFWSWSGLVPYKGRSGEWVGPTYDSLYDMANIVLYDSIPFTLFDSTTGTYEFVRNMRLNDKVQFFALDGKGFGEEPEGKGHNYSFTMELHHEFTYHGGEYFEFFGDDDAWAFIDGKRVMDLGGMQSEAGETIDLDALAPELGLEIGRKYMFDFFYTERRTFQSNIVVTTNILTPSKPNRLVILPDSATSVPGDSLAGLEDTTIEAGECLSLFAYVVDDTGAVRNDWSPNTIWEVFDSLGNPLNIIPKSGSNEFCLTEAFGCVSVVLTYQDSLFPGIVLHDTVNICVEAGPPDHLVLEAGSDSTVSLRNDNPLDVLSLAGDESAGSVFAILRDSYGNFAGYATDAQWNTFDSDVATAASGESTVGEGVITRIATSGATSITAFSGGVGDTVDVLLESISYTALRIVSGNTTLRDVDTLRIRSDQDTTLTALGMRSDNGEWDNVLVRWSSAGVTLQPGAPSGTDRWIDLSPVSAGTGIITISRSGSSGTIADTAVVIASNGLPERLVLYPSAGAPGGGNTPLPLPSISINVSAGVNYSATAKLFDSRGNWLEAMENVNAPILWRVVEISGNPPTGTLLSNTGAFVSYFPQRAHNSIFLVAEYQGASVPLSDTIMLSIRPGAAHHLVIEGSSDRNRSPNADDPLQTLLFTSTDTDLNVYAVLRDSLGNFIRFSQRTVWSSIDSLIASVTAGNASYGEGIVHREVQLGQTFVVARNGDDTTLVDTCEVVLSTITFDSLRIVVNHNGLRDIAALSMRSGNDTLLYALGLRSDTRQWVAVRVAWSSTGLSATTPAPSSSDQWNFAPVASADGFIIISNGTISDTVSVTVTEPVPDRLVLYPEAGQPSLTNAPYRTPPLSDTVAAGDSVPLVAKLFTEDNIWLQAFENDSVAIQWSVMTTTGDAVSSATLRNRTGAFTAFYPEQAYVSVFVIARFTWDNRALADTLQLYVKPGNADHMVIESSPEWASSPNSDNPIDPVIFGYMDSVVYVYAMLRDRFGNFVGYPGDVAWTSADAAVVTASRGITSVGEGRLIRRTASGATSVSASDGSGRTDTTRVILSVEQYDSLRIISIDGNSISRLDMATTDDTTLFVQGKNSDNGVWETVSADWFTTGTLTASPGAPSRSGSWLFSPLDTGSGTINATLGSGASLISVAIPAEFTAGNPNTLILYPKSGTPGFGNERYPPVGSPIEVSAGSFITIVAKLFDGNGIWLPQYEEHDQPFTWRIIEPPGLPASGTLSDTTGFATIFSPVRAYRTVLIAAEYPSLSGTLGDTIEVTIVPGPAHHLVIEADQNREISPNADNPLETVTLTSKEDFRRVFAIIRDELGNWIDYSLITEWSSEDTLIAAVEDGIAGIGEGIIQRVDTGTVFITARNRESRYGDLILLDSVRVLVKSIWYLRLRILDASGAQIDTLRMSTNDDTTLVVQGMRSDDSTWENIQAQWEVGPTLIENIAPPLFSQQWRFSPSAPAEDWIRVTLGVDTITLPDTVWGIFTRGEPLYAQMELLTSRENLIAGDTITALVSIYNSNGLIPEGYCFSADSETGGAFYYDTLHRASRPDPELFISQTHRILSTDAEDDVRHDQCFTEGVDTVRFILYYAPDDDALFHRLAVALGDLPEASVRFDLLPAELDSLAIETNGVSGNDTIVLNYPHGGSVFTAIGFDRFGNRRGSQTALWTTDGTLHQLENTGATSRIYYESSNVVTPERGYITISPTDSFSEVHSADIYVIITGPIISLTTAYTKDADGNGYLDGITLHFSASVALPDTIPGIRIIYGMTELSVDQVIAENDSDSVWTILLSEDSSGSAPQTSWTPYLDFDTLEGIASAEQFVVEDGAGPVLWRVVKKVEDVHDRRKDLLTIEFSEPVSDGFGSQLNLITPPESLFVVWWYDEAGTFQQLPGALDGIENMQFVDRDKAVFYLTNGIDISSRHFINFNAENGMVTDFTEQSNAPHPENRRVRVAVDNKGEEIVTIIPNPGSVTFSRIKAGVLSAAHEPRAREWIRQDHAGSVISFKLTIPEEGTVKVTISIHDMAGNLVAYDHNPDIVENLPRGMPGYPIDIYWNGSNKEGMPVAPGIYRTTVYLKYTAESKKRVRLVSKIGIAH